MKKKILAIAGAVAVVLAAVLVFTLTGNEQIRKSENSLGDLIESGDLKLSKLDDELLSDLFSYRFKAGSAYVYDFRRSVRIEFRKQEVANLAFTGVLTAHAVRVEADKLELVIDVQFQTARGLEQDTSGKSQKDKVHTVLLKLDRKGDTIDILYPKGRGDEDDAAIMNDIVSKWLTILPDNDEIQKSRAEKTEGEFERVFNRIAGGGEVGPIAVRSEDTQGQYGASFTARQIDDTQVEVIKKKIRYYKSAALIKIEGSENNHIWDSAAGYFKRVSGTESFSYGDSSFGARSDQIYRYEFKNIIKSAYSAQDLAFYTESLDFYDETGTRGQLRQMAGAPIKTWKEIKAMLAGIKAGTPQKKKNNIFNSLAASLKNDKNMTPAVLKEVRVYKVGTEQYRMLMGALTYAGTPEAQDGLRAMYRGGENGDPGRDSVIQAFTMMDEPITRISKRFLTDTFKNANSPELRDNAGLALGSSLRNGKGDDAETEKIRETLMNEWRNATSDARKARVLEMLGNSGDEYFFDLMKEVHQGSPNPHLRRLSVYAMRFIDTEKVSRYILDVPLKHQDAGVRSAAIEALSMQTFRKFSYEPLAAVIKNEKAASLRLKASEVLLGQEDPEIRTRTRALLESVKDNAPAEFRDYIEKLNDNQA